ncbi:hypothetical protein AB4559_19945 [Vibrio sp. 10N.222.51.C8]|jgi:hypothetical protein|uniref:hypothetical protein n=1 Tax=unclassified Vibrio TaxID=2614977 RepID=UPI000C860DB7|nr:MULTISPECIES: hypothetical protein [unclassified Vibrio]PMO01654.1 hypothetical protein BCT20_11415 [Vibrio sp. 10N.222.55.C12]PMO02823.1 hypothetical protein BCT21_07265 [Vibrio sp. 10N.222.55.F9]PMO13583.1 hypothetical protein BCT17_14345 [Vibrio sp. 10N.222.54.F10]PMO14650.1 hypothetical protein BCT16_18875 [Vibrio sp. 10N.222.54.B6]TKF38524.1 hypothetical protein FCV49_21695 [Vibrio sp. F13]
MSLEQYQQLALNSVSELGVQLPLLLPAHIKIESFTGALSDAFGHIETLQPTDGWAMYRDAVVISQSLPNRSDLIEAEYCNSETTVHIQLIGGSTYRITHYVSQKARDNATKFCFSEQELSLRSDLSRDAELACYRLWYQQVEGGGWEPLAQQFIGFAYSSNGYKETLK